MVWSCERISRWLGGSWRFLAGLAGGVVGVRVCCLARGLVVCVCVWAGGWVTFLVAVGCWVGVVSVGGV